MNKLKINYFFVLIILVLLFSVSHAQSDSSLIFLSVNVTSSNETFLRFDYLYPEDNAVDGDGNFYFNCSASGSSNLSNISLYFNGVLNQTVDVGGYENSTEFSLLNLPNGTYNWSCEVFDYLGNSNTSGTRKIIYNQVFLPIAYNFSGNTTNWTNLPDLGKVCNGTAVLDNPSTDKIQWHNCVNVTAADFDANADLAYNNVSVNFGLGYDFNSSATITIRNLPWDATPLIYRDGVLCTEPECSNVSYVNGTAIFNVTHFTSYVTAGNSEMIIWDETDTGMPYADKIKYKDEDVKFFANYTKKTNGNPITGATCYINFTDSNNGMTYNSTTALYEYTRQFSQNGTFNWNVTCSASGFQTLTTNDTVVITADIISPTLTIISPIATTYTNATIFVNISATDNLNVSQVWYNWNGTNTTYTTPVYIDFPDGTYTLHAWANDTSNNLNYTNITFVVNTTIPNSKPWVVLNYPADSATINDDLSIDFNYTAYDNEQASLTCTLYINGSSVDSSAVINATPKIVQYNFTQYGTYSWNVTCTDSSLSNYSETRTFTLVNTSNPAPTVVLNYPTDGETFANGTTSVRLNWTSSDNNASVNDSVYVNGINVYSQNHAPGTYYYDLATADNTTYTWYVNSSDGTSITKSEIRNFTINETIIYNGAPVVVLNYPINLTINDNLTIEFNYTAYDNEQTELNCTLFADNAPINNSIINNATEIIVEHTFLTYGIHYWNVTCRDNQTTNNTGYSETAWINLNNTNITDNETPIINLISPINNYNFIVNNITLIFDVLDNSNTIQNCSLILNNILNATQNTLSNGTYNFTLTNLANGDYNWSVECYDFSANYNISETRNFTINATTIICGNNIQEAGEDCDGIDLGGETCNSLGYKSGTLTCTASCTFNRTRCVSGGSNGCTEDWKCSSWSKCIDGKQTRTCYDVNNCGTNRNKPETARTCTCTEDWKCTEFSSCYKNKQTRTCYDANNCGTEKDKPVLTVACSCTEDWKCTEWGSCENEIQLRECKDINNCGTEINKPKLYQTCIKCEEDWYCSEWENCTDNQARRYCYDRANCNTTISKPVTSMICPQKESPLNILGRIIWWMLIITLGALFVVLAARRRRQIVSVKKGVSIDLRKKSKKVSLIERIIRNIKSKQTRSNKTDQIPYFLIAAKKKLKEEKQISEIKEVKNSIEEDIKRLQRSGFAVKGLFEHKPIETPKLEAKKEEIITPKTEQRPIETKKLDFKGFKTREKINEDLAKKGFRLVNTEIPTEKKLYSIIYKHTKGKLPKIEKINPTGKKEVTIEREIKIIKPNEEGKTNVHPVKKVEVPKSKDEILIGLKKTFDFENERR